MKLASSQNINCRDTQGRNSTPLHLAGKYDRLWSHLGLITGICFNNYIFNKHQMKWHYPVHKKWSFKYFFSKCDQIRSFLWFGHIYWRNPVTLISMTHSLFSGLQSCGSCGISAGIRSRRKCSRQRRFNPPPQCFVLRGMFRCLFRNLAHI